MAMEWPWSTTTTQWRCRVNQSPTLGLRTPPPKSRSRPKARQSWHCRPNCRQCNSTAWASNNSPPPPYTRHSSKHGVAVDTAVVPSRPAAEAAADIKPQQRRDNNQPRPRRRSSVSKIGTTATRTVGTSPSPTPVKHAAGQVQTTTARRQGQTHKTACMWASTRRSSLQRPDEYQYSNNSNVHPPKQCGHSPHPPPCTPPRTLPR